MAAGAAPDPAPSFYEDFWADEEYNLRYSFDAAVRDRFPALEAVWGSLQRPGRVLDWGCGNGVLSYWMHANGFGTDVLGLDISSTAIAHARRAFSRDGLGFEVLEPDAGPAHLGAFDVALASHVLEHLDDPGATVRQLAQAAEWVVLEVPLEDAAVVNWRKGRGVERPANDVGHVNFWTRRTFLELVEGCGLMVVREHHYASAPFSPYVGNGKRLAERSLLRVLGVRGYGRLMATHLTVLARPLDPS